MHALLLIDIQVDFLPNGALGIPTGDQVIEVANRAMERAEYVVATQDWHPSDHLSFASQHPGAETGDFVLVEGRKEIAWPDHCVAGTPGAELALELHRDRIDFIAKKGTDRRIDSYSAFFDNDHRHSTGLDEHLKSLDVRELTVMGLATDYCVKFTVLDAVNLGYTTHVLLSGCRGVGLLPSDVPEAIERMRGAGAEIIQGDQFA